MHRSAHSAFAEVTEVRTFSKQPSDAETNTATARLQLRYNPDGMLLKPGALLRSDKVSPLAPASPPPHSCFCGRVAMFSRSRRRGVRDGIFAGAEEEFGERRFHLHRGHSGLIRFLSWSFGIRCQRFQSVNPPIHPSIHHQFINLLVFVQL